MKTLLRPALMMVFLVLANSLAAQRSWDQIEREIAAEQRMCATLRGILERLHAEFDSLYAELNQAKGWDPNSKGRGPSNDPARPMKEARLAQLERDLRSEQSKYDAHSARLLQLGNELAALQDQQRRNRAGGTPHKPTGRQLGGAGEEPDHGPLTRDPDGSSGGNYPPSPSPSAPKSSTTPWPFSNSSPTADWKLSLLKPTPAEGAEPAPVSAPLQPSKPSDPKADPNNPPGSGMKDPRLGLRTRQWQNPETMGVETLFVDPKGNVYSSDGSPLDDYYADAVRSVMEAENTAFAESERRRGVFNEERRFYHDMVKDWEKRFEQGKATWAEHPTRIKVPEGLPGGGLTTTYFGGAAENYFNAVIKPRAERTARDIQSPDLLARGIVRTNFGSNMEDYVNIMANSTWAERAEVPFNSIVRTIITDQDVADSIELARRTKGEVAHRYGEPASMEDTAMATALERSRYDWWSKNKKGYFTEESTHAEKYVNGTVLGNPLQLPRPPESDRGIQTDTPTPPTAPANPKPADATTSKAPPKSG